MRRSLAAVAALLAGCAVAYPTFDATTEVELVLVAETSRFAKLQKVDVRAELTDKRYTGIGADNKPWEAAGWYADGVAYFNRAMVERWVSIEPEPYHQTAANVANHEVCHAKNPYHDLAHWNCMSKWAQPTYGRPE